MRVMKPVGLTTTTCRDLEELGEALDTGTAELANDVSDAG
jgi:hypothetical protein